MVISARRLLSAILILVVAILVGIVGYQAIEGWGFLDSLYMTVITLATVGYGETHPLSPEGRIFTIVLIFTGVGTLAYGLSTATAFVVEGTLNNVLERRRMDREISRMKNHIIVCGGGETGRHIIEEFIKTGVPFVVIEKDVETIKQLKRVGRFSYIEGDATQDEILLEAGIKKAKGLITTLPLDKDNLFVILTARDLNPDLRIVTKALEPEERSKLTKVGADVVVPTSYIGGLRMASEMVRPTVVSFLDRMLRRAHDAVRVEEAQIPVGSPMAGRTLRESEIFAKTGLVIIGLVRGDSHEFNLPPDTLLLEGDALIVCCTPEQLQNFKNVLAG